MRWLMVLGLASWPALVRCLASTDSIQDVDPEQSGYLPNHNMNPQIISSSKFAIQWTKVYNNNEVFYAKPLVYTPNGYPNELVILVSNQNNLRIVDGLTGALVNMITLEPPFQSVDTQCSDIPNTVGITGTPIIDPQTDIMYFFAKGYKSGTTSGTLNGQYNFYAVHIPTLQVQPGFPVSMEGHFANNDPTRYFVGGTILQRPSLASVGGSIIAGFGGHCDNFNYTGMLLSVTKTTGAVTNIIAMEASPGAPSPQATDYTVQGGGKAGIWQSGMGIATDGNRVYFATGNGRGGGVNKGGAPASGKIAISTLEEVVASFSVDASGVLTQSDYFEPFEYNNLDGADKDFGSSGVSLLDPTVFSGNGITQMAAAGGKSGKVYLLDANNLGGFAMGPGGSDAVVQTIPNAHSLFSGIGSYPLEGGYIYYIPTDDALYAYKMGKDGSGNPLFTFAGKSAAKFAGKGVPTVTSLNGQAGTGIVWVADVNLGLVAYNAVPVGGVLQPIASPKTSRLTKDRRPAFGNGRVYVSNGATVVGLGTPGNLPLTTTSSSTLTTSTTSTTSTSTTSTSTTSTSTTSTSTTSTSTTSTSTTSTSTTSTSTTSTSTTSTTSPSSPSSSSSTSTSSAPSSTSSGTLSTTLTTSSTTTTGPSSNTATTTTSSSIQTTLVTSTVTTATATTSAYQYIGCFRDIKVGHALPLLFANNSVTPELCAAYVESLANKPTPTALPYFFVEYHRECYGGTAFNFAGSSVTSLTGAHACTDICSGSIGAATTGTAFCGGPKQFNLYATNGVVNFPNPPVTSSV